MIGIAYFILVINAIGAIIATLILIYIAKYYHVDGIASTYILLSVATLLFIFFLSIYILLNENDLAKASIPLNWRLNLFGTFIIFKHLYLAWAIKQRNARRNG